MPKIKPGKYYKWTRDEIIIVLSLYKRLDIKRVPHENKLQEYSDILDKLAKSKGIKSNDGGAYRSIGSVALRIANFINLDGIDKTNIKGLYRFGKLVKEIWNEFSDNQAGLEEEEKQILALIDAGVKIENPIEYDVHGYAVTEGRKKIIKEHEARERNPTIVKLKKDTAKTLVCEVCGFLFKDFYGFDFIECHHKNPMAQKGKSGETSLDDLALVCSNCHRMIHRGKGDCLTIEQLNDKIDKLNLNKFK